MVILGVGLYGAATIHNLVHLPMAKQLRACDTIFAIAVPAVATQLATPVGNAYITAKSAEFGDEAVAAWAIIGRLIPVAFEPFLRFLAPLALFLDKLWRGSLSAHS